MLANAQWHDRGMTAARQRSACARAEPSLLLLLGSIMKPPPTHRTPARGEGVVPFGTSGKKRLRPGRLVIEPANGRGTLKP